MRTGKLTVKRVEQILAGREPDRIEDKRTGELKRKRDFGDGGGLWLVVRKRDDAGKPIAASWVYRYWLHGKAPEMGLGSAWDVRLADVRERARQCRVQVRTDGVDVLAERKNARRQRREAAKIEAAKRMTFRECAESLVAAKAVGWKNPKSFAQWMQTLETYAYPVIGNLPVAEVNTALVVKIIEPIWLKKTETASRLRGRIEKVLDRAKTLELRTGENPARWKGHLEHILEPKSKVAPVEHHAALSYEDIGAFVAELRLQDGTAARAFEFAILTCGRTGEVIRMRWCEFDEAKRLWIVPPERMKSGKEHKVPLSDRALAILAEMKAAQLRRPCEYAFQGIKDGQPLSNMALLMLLRRMGHPELTVHGFRATARSWMAAQTNFPREVAEMALAHDVGERVERTYQRSDMFEKRRRLAEAWARYCDKPNGNGKVVAIESR